MGPRLSAGKNVNAPTIRITPTSSTVNKVVFTGNVPDEGGTLFFERQVAGQGQHAAPSSESAPPAC